jgi:chromosomal replication initiation ATPase DnaA
MTPEKQKETKMGSTRIPKKYGKKFDNWISAVCKVFMVRPEELFWATRGPQRTAWARQLMYALILREVGSATETAVIFNRTHASVCYGVRVLKERCKNDKKIRELVREVGKEIEIQMFKC